MSVETYFSRLKELSEREAEEFKSPGAIGCIHLELAKLLIDFNINDCKAAGVEEPYKSSIWHCEVARRYFGAEKNYTALRADSHGIQGTATMFSGSASASLVLYEAALLEAESLDCLAQEPPIDNNWLSQRKRLWRKNRALALQYVGRMAESIQEYQQLFQDVSPEQDRAEFLHLAFLLVTAFSDTSRTHEGFRILEVVQTKVSLENDSEKIRFYSARAELHFVQGDIGHALDDAHRALNLFLDDAENLSDLANIVIRVARYHIQVGDFEKANEFMGAYKRLYPSASGVMLEVNQLCIDAYLAHHLGDADKCDATLTKLCGILSKEPEDEVMSFWSVYFGLRAQALIHQRGHRAALDALQANQVVTRVVASTPTRESFPIALTVLSCVVMVEESPASFIKLAQVLVNRVSYCTKINQWQVPLSIARWYSRMGEDATAAEWAWLAIQSTRVQQLPLYGSVEQANRTLIDRNEPWVLLEHIVARLGNLYDASEIRRRRHSAELEFRSSGKACFEDLKAYAENVIRPNRALSQAWAWLCQSHEKSDQHQQDFSSIELPLPSSTPLFSPTQQTVSVNTSSLSDSENHCVISFSMHAGAVWITVDNKTLRSHVELNASLPTIRETVFNLLNSIEQRRDWLSLSQALYQQVIAPIAHLLRQTVSVFGQDVFGQLPFSALHDGEAYLVTRHRFQIGLVSASNMFCLPGSADIVFIGSSGYQGSWPMLDPLVEKNVFSVFKQPIVELIDDAATPQSIQVALRSKPHVVHIFSHSQANPNSVYKSQWLFSGGRAMSLAQLVQDSDDWQRLPLLFLASCDTGYRVSHPTKHFSSIPEVFTALGVSNVIAAYGRLTDSDHTTFAHRFYDEFNQCSEVGTALQRAQCYFVDDPHCGWSSYGHWVG